MLKGMVIPGDMVEEGEDEGVSADDSSRTPSPKEEYMFEPARARSSEEYVFRPLTTPPPSTGKTKRKRKLKEPFYKGYGVVYLPGDKGDKGTHG